MLDLTTEQLDALSNRQVMRRTFVWCEAADPDTGEPDPAGFWDDVGNVQFDDRIYYGSGTLFGISTLSAKSDQSIPGITITLSGVSDDILDKIRRSNLAQAPMEVAIGIFDPVTHNIIPPLIRRFVGVIDDIEVVTPKAGEKSTVVFMCESTSRALTIKSSNTRSGSTQRQRAEADAFYDYTAAMSEAPMYFGRSSP